MFPYISQWPCAKAFTLWMARRLQLKGNYGMIVLKPHFVSCILLNCCACLFFGDFIKNIVRLGQTVQCPKSRCLLWNQRLTAWYFGKKRRLSLPRICK